MCTYILCSSDLWILRTDLTEQEGVEHYAESKVMTQYSLEAPQKHWVWRARAGSIFWSRFVTAMTFRLAWFIAEKGVRDQQTVYDEIL